VNTYFDLFTTALDYYLNLKIVWEVLNTSAVLSLWLWCCSNATVCTLHLVVMHRL